MLDGSPISIIVDNDEPSGSTIIGTAITQMEAGQEVSDSLQVLCCASLKVTIGLILTQLRRSFPESASFG